MGTANGMVDAMAAYLGMGEPNRVQRWYAERNGAAFDYNFAWCDALITKAAFDSGNHRAVCPRGDRAYTPWHANDFEDASLWRPGTRANIDDARPGDIVFFDWGGSKKISLIDHVGVVVRALGNGRVETIEGNTDNRCLRRVRSYTVLAGYGRPAYTRSTASPTPSNWTEKAVKQLPTLRKGDTGEHVQTLQALLNARSHPEVKIDGDFGGTTEAALRAVQSWGGVDADGVAGRATWPVLLRVAD